MTDNYNQKDTRKKVQTISKFSKEYGNTLKNSFAKTISEIEYITLPTVYKLLNKITCVRKDVKCNSF